MTLQAFFALLEKKLPDIQKLPENKALDETQMIDKIIARGYNHLQETSLWESSHYEMRAEYGRERSFMKQEKMIELMDIMSKQLAGATVEDIDNQLASRGMRLSIIDKIYILKSQKDKHNIRLKKLLSSVKE